MSIQSRRGRGLKRVLEWVLDRDIKDSEIASALNKPPATFFRRKTAEDFPTFHELDAIGRHFGVNPRWLQVEFNYLDKDELREEPSLLLVEQKEVRRKRTKVTDLQVRDDVPPLN